MQNIAPQLNPAEIETALRGWQHPLPAASLLVLAVVLIGVVYTEMAGRKIPNWLTFSATGLGFILSCGSGNGGLLSSILGFALGFGFFLPFWVLSRRTIKKYGRRAVGGGDMKLMGAVGALLGLQLVQVALVYMAILGAMLAMGMVVWSRDFWVNIRFLLRKLHLLPADTAEVAPVSKPVLVPYGLAVAGGCLLTLLVRAGQ